MKNTCVSESETADGALQAGDAHVPCGSAQNPNLRIEDVDPAGLAQNLNGQDARVPIENPKSKIPNCKRPYVRKRTYQKTAAREAAFLANFKKAQAAPK